MLVGQFSYLKRSPTLCRLLKWCISQQQSAPPVQQPCSIPTLGWRTVFYQWIYVKAKAAETYIIIEHECYSFRLVMSCGRLHWNVFSKRSAKSKGRDIWMWASATSDGYSSDASNSSVSSSSHTYRNCRTIVSGDRLFIETLIIACNRWSVCSFVNMAHDDLIQFSVLWVALLWRQVVRIELKLRAWNF